MRLKTARAVLGFVVIAGLALGACSDRSVTAPAAIDRGGDQSSLLGGLLGTVNQLLFSPLQRTAPLAQKVTWTFTAGPAGAMSSNSAVGLTIVIPPNALSSTKTFTVTAFAGSPIAYGFEPHVTFNKKVWLTQNLSGTSAGLVKSVLMHGAHFPGSTPTYTASGLALVDEIVPGLAILGQFTWGVRHFSGWHPGSGYMAEGSSEGQ